MPQTTARVAAGQTALEFWIFTQQALQLVMELKSGRIALAEHGQEASTGLLMFGESVAAGIERSQPKPLEPRNLDQPLLTVGPQVWGNALPHAQPFLLESDGQTWHCPTNPIRAD